MYSLTPFYAVSKIDVLGLLALCVIFIVITIVLFNLDKSGRNTFHADSGASTERKVFTILSYIATVVLIGQTNYSIFWLLEKRLPQHEENATLLDPQFSDNSGTLVSYRTDSGVTVVFRVPLNQPIYPTATLYVKD